MRCTEASRGSPDNLLETQMAWTTPAATDLRFGFEVTMYIATR
ncbi:MAG: pyrroloquinoline quinone precursor peptide PqqA [Pseudomonadota bacterium]|nr:pyrroloquinoline quinone precursor peptide PqqA [Pseudomonadota bacterium]